MSMSRSRVRLGSVFLLIASVALFPASAEPPPFPFELPPLVRTDPLPGIGTLAYRFSIPDGADVALSIESEFAEASLLGDGLWLFDSDFELLFGAWGTSIGGGPLEYHVEAPEPIGVLVDRPAPDNGGFGSGSTLLISGLPAGQYVVFMGATSDGTFVSGSAAVYGTEGTTVISTSGGPGGFVHRESDFRGLNALVGAGGIRARGILGAAVEETIDRPVMFGEFSYFGDAEVARLTLEGPTGSQSSTFGHLIALAPSGDYRFVIDADLGIGNLYAWGVESAIPPPGLPTTGA
jgi:hypothetical protein